LADFRVACLPEDTQLLERARAAAEAIMGSDPQLQAPEHVLLGAALHMRFRADPREPISA
jgi:RecG-like helicase